jgi:hypothetical protein
MTFVRFKNLNVGRSRPSNKFQTHSIGNENLGIGDCATSRRSAQKDARRRGQALKAPLEVHVWLKAAWVIAENRRLPKFARPG